MFTQSIDILWRIGVAKEEIEFFLLLLIHRFDVLAEELLLGLTLQLPSFLLLNLSGCKCFHLLLISRVLDMDD